MREEGNTLMPLLSSLFPLPSSLPLRMSTPVSNPSSYCTPSDFLDRYDWRFVAELMSDEGIQPDRLTLVTPGTGPNQRLQALLDSAAGEVEAACLVASRYTPTDLAGLTGVAAKFLKQLVADLAIGLAGFRRPHLDKPIPPQVERADAQLDRLRKGQSIFGIQETMDAGVVQSEIETEAIRQIRGLTSTQSRRFFGQRAEINRPGSGW